MFVQIAIALLSLHADAAPVSSLYARIEAKLAQRPELAASLGQAPPELKELRWMLGRWSVRSRVFAQGDAFEESGESVVEEILGGTWLQIRDSREGEVADLGFLSFNPVTRQWIAVGFDRTGNAVTSVATQWDGRRLSFVAKEAVIVGERVVLRQTLEKVSDREYRILNEEQLANGTWARIDEYVYLRR